MRSGPKAIHYRDSLFRVSELVWVKAYPLSPFRLVLKILLILAGLLFPVAVHAGKGDWKNVECALCFFVFPIALSIQSDSRLASTGDLAESYEARGGEGEDKAFRSWVSALGDGTNDCKVGSSNAPYFCWFNLNRIAWARPCWLFNLTGLLALPIYLGYAWLIQQDFKWFHAAPALDDIKFMVYPDGSSDVIWLCWGIVILSLLAVLSSLGRGLEVRACGGLSDRFRVNRLEQTTFLNQLAGFDSAAPTVVEVPVEPTPPQP
jgi:hypothetical protein